MEKYSELIKQSYEGWASYLWQEITHPHWKSFFWWTIGLSIFFFGLELLKPWRKEQARFRKDFWLDLFYIFFNFFLFNLIVWKAGQDVLTQGFNDFLGLFGVENILAEGVMQLPIWLYFILIFLVADFVSWNVHRLLHRIPWMWEFHKVHHSVEQMGFAAHVRYHWMENVIYWFFRFIPLTILGADLADIFAIHVLNVAWGHFNHANITVNPRLTGTIFGGLAGLGLAVVYAGDWFEWLAFIGGGLTVFGLVLGPYMRIIFNSPEMHIWHHAWDLPVKKRYGVNFGITMALWDYIWGTVHMPHTGRDIRLGFPKLEDFPKGFLGQLIYGFGKRKG